jgi:hypothetical protein
MRKYAIGIFCLYFLLGPTHLIAAHPSPAMGSTSNVEASDILSIIEDLTGAGPTNIPLAIFILILGFALGWILLYFFLYPALLKYYHPSYCKRLFWLMFLLYAFSLFNIIAFFYLNIGFTKPWYKWVASFFGVGWLGSFLTIILSKKPDEFY